MPKGKGTQHFFQLTKKLNVGAFTMQLLLQGGNRMKTIKENTNPEICHFGKYILWYFSWISTKY